MADVPASRVREPVTIQELVDAPERAVDVPAAEAKGLLVKLAAVAEGLRLAAASAPHSRNGMEAGPDEMLTADQAAPRTGMSKRWLYAQAKAGRLSFAVRPGPGSVRFSAHGIASWLAQRKDQQRRTTL